MKIANIQQLKSFRDRVLSKNIFTEYVHCDFTNITHHYPRTFFDLSFHECREIFVILYDLFVSQLCPEYFIFTFDRNLFHIEFAEILTAAFKKGKPPNFLALNFKNCLMGDDAVIELSTMLRSPNTPKNLTLNLENNAISQKSGAHLADTIRSGYCKDGFKLFLNSNAFLSRNVVMNLLESTAHPGCPKNFHLSIEKCPLIFDIEEKNVAEIINSEKCKEGLTLSLGTLLITENSVNANSTELSIPKVIKANKFPTNLNLSFYCSSLANIYEQPSYIDTYKIYLGTAIRALFGKRRGIHIQCDGTKILHQFETEKQGNDYFTQQKINLFYSIQNKYTSTLREFLSEQEKMIATFQSEQSALLLKMRRRSLEQAKTEPECPICFEDYIKPGHTRKFLLPCRHMLCKACLERLHIDALKEQKSVKCPTCRWHVSNAE